MKFTIIQGIASGAALMLSLSAAQVSQAQTVSWGSAFGAKLLDSNDLPLGDNFKFELGSFNTGFAPAANDAALWEADWQGFDLATADNNGFASAIGFVNRSVAIDETGQTTSTAFAPEVQNFDFRDKDVYLWAYQDDKSLDGGNEFALITDPEWKFPLTVSPTGAPLGFRLALTNTAILGTADNGTVNLQTVAVGTTAVPEPTTALLTILGGCTLVFRRRRNRS